MKPIHVNVDILSDLNNPSTLNASNILYQTWLKHISEGGAIIFEKVDGNNSETVKIVDNTESLNAFLGLDEEIK